MGELRVPRQRRDLVERWDVVEFRVGKFNSPAAFVFSLGPKILSTRDWPSILPSIFPRQKPFRNGSAGAFFDSICR